MTFTDKVGILYTRIRNTILSLVRIRTAKALAAKVGQTVTIAVRGFGDTRTGTVVSANRHYVVVHDQAGGYTYTPTWLAQLR